MTQLVSNGEGGAEPVVLNDGARVFVAHRAQLGEAQGVAILAWGVGIPANILPI